MVFTYTFIDKTLLVADRSAQNGELVLNVVQALKEAPTTN